MTSTFGIGKAIGQKQNGENGQVIDVLMERLDQLLGLTPISVMGRWAKEGP